MTARGVILLLSLATLASGCKDLGLPGNMPLEEARSAPPRPLEAVASARDTVEPGRLIVEGRLWVPFGRPRGYAEDALRPIGSADGHTVYARRWDQPPYRGLFIPRESAAQGQAAAGAGAWAQPQWQPYAPVIGRSARLPEGAGGAGGAAPDHDAGH